MSATTTYPTLASAEEQHLAAMSSSSTTTLTKTGKKKTVKKVSSKKISSTSSIELLDGQVSTNGLSEMATQKQQIEMHTIEESHSSKESSAAISSKTNGTVEQKTKILKKKVSATKSISIDQEEVQQQQQTSALCNEEQLSSTTVAVNGKKKVKKSKKAEAEKENISVKSSFSKFDALQKKNLIHEPQTEKERNCRLCSKPVYKMEEIKAEKSIYHKNCFRCQECDKQLKVDNYQSHEGVLYCMVHFKLLFAPKFVEDSAPEKPRKPELIIRENQPVELPPDVVRASDKPDLGLEELQQLNVRSRFQVFEKGAQQHQQLEKQSSVERSPSGAGVKRSQSILSKMAKLQARGFTTGLSIEHLENVENDGEDEDDASSATSQSESDQDGSGSEEGVDRDLVRSKKRTQRERPVGIGKAMNDIKTKFEKGPMMSKEERREERKQEIQNIRSRLFMGKQARIKEMYQQAVADSEQSITSVGKKSEIDIGDKARSLKQRFETGELFKDKQTESETDGSRSGGVQVDDADVFESAISKKSRSIFMELDASAAAGKNQTAPLPRPEIGLQRTRSSASNRYSESEQEKQQENVVKHDEKLEDIQIATSEISSKFKFFETYRPSECQKKEFRMTPPREGVVKFPAPESDGEGGIKKTVDADAEIIEKTHIASTMLNKFREMEQRKQGNNVAGPRPLKCFTPPPDGGRRLYNEQESDAASEEGEEEAEEEDNEQDYEEEDEEQYKQSKLHLNDEALKEAQAAARAKQLRAKFEKWEANEIRREMQEGRVNVYSDQVSDETTIESTKSIRERFENMKNLEKKSAAGPRYQVNRFV